MEFEKVIGVSLKHSEYYEQALIHRSYLQVLNSGTHYSNERLEFLGDSILGFVIAEYLFHQHSTVHEGELTKMRSWLVNKKSLSICARSIGLNDYLLLSFSAAQSLKRGNDSMLADALESVIAAIYLDHSINEARDFIIERLFPIMIRESLMQDTNFKSILLEYVQAQSKNAPRYLIHDENGPDHDKVFTVGVYVDDECLGIGSGKNKKDAEQHAAEVALEQTMAIKIRKD